MYSLIICEKPKVAERIADALGSARMRRKTLNGVAYYEIERGGKRLLAAPAVGHLYTLKQKDGGRGYPIFDIEWVPAHSSKESAFTEKYLKTLEALGAGASECINACDYDLEGSVIGANIIEYACKAKSAKRMKFSMLTKDELVDAYEHAGALDYANVEAGRTRHMLDWLWGINLSRALMAAIKSAGAFKVLSIGRVQGPALALLAKRELEITRFAAKPYWQVLAHFDFAVFTHEKGKFWDRGEAERALAGAKGDALVKSVERRKYKQLPPTPFDLTTLQLEAYRWLGIAPSKTLDVAQSLYEAGLISYPRSSSQQLSERLGLSGIIAQLAKNPRYAFAAELLGANLTQPHNGKKTDAAHPAIHPTGAAPGALGEAQQRVYDLIVKRFLACFARSAVRESLTAALQIGSERFIASGARTLEANWHRFYAPYVKFEEIEFPMLGTGDALQPKRVEMQQKETQPPKRYTAASIISELEKRNLGTKATRSAIVDTLYQRGYLKDKNIAVTPLGLRVCDALERNAPLILSEEMTRTFEREMEQIQEGKECGERVVNEAKQALGSILSDFSAKEDQIGGALLEAFSQRKSMVLGACPKCGKNVAVLTSKRSGKRFVGCEGYANGCRFSAPLPQRGALHISDKKCPKCSLSMVRVLTRGRKPWEFCVNKECAG